MLKRLAIIGLLIPLATVGILADQDAPKGTPEQGITKAGTGQSGQQQAGTQGNSQAAPKSPAAIVETDAPKDEAAKAEARENLKIQRELAVFTGLLVFVGFLQVGTMLWQAWLLKQTRGDVHEQAGWMKAQVGHMKDQTEILGKSVAAAQASADAAKDQIQMMKNKEKARIRIEPGSLEISTFEGDAWTAEVDLRIFNFGQTGAFLDETRASLIFTPASAIQTEKCPRPMISDTVIGPTKEPIQKRLYQFSGIDSDTIWSLNTENVYAQTYGFIAYTDAFGDKHRTSFRYIWRANGWLVAASTALSGGDDPIGSKKLYGEWEKTKEDNEES